MKNEEENSFLCIMILGVIFTGCTKEKEGKQITNSEEVENSSESQCKESAYQGNIEKFTYLSRDELFLLEMNNDDRVLVNTEGKIQNSKELKSDYLYTEGTKTEAKQIYDMYDNNVQDRFIEDDKREKILDICRIDTQDVIWVWESQENPSSSLIIIKAFDENGKELCRVDSNNPIFNKNVSDNFKDITSVVYSGDVTCRIRYTDASTNELFSVNVETGEIIDIAYGLESPVYSDGYAIGSEGIQDIHGNKKCDLPYDTFGNDLTRYSDGLFMSLKTKKFYDINLNEKIDLSNYDVLFWNGNDYGSWKNAYVFKDGYCGIEVENENGTRFYGVIDKKGNWILELTDESSLNAGAGDYCGKVTDTKIRLGSRIYDFKTKTFQDTPFYLVNDVDSILLRNKYYYINDENEFCYYDPDTDTSMMIEIE